MPLVAVWWIETNSWPAVLFADFTVKLLTPSGDVVPIATWPEELTRTPLVVEFPKTIVLSVEAEPALP